MEFLELLSSIRWIEWELTFLQVVEQVRDRLGGNPIAMQRNIGEEEGFEGVVDLLTMKAVYWKEENMGVEFDEKIFQLNLLAECEELRETLVESAAEANEELMDQYLEDGELTIDEIKAGMRVRTLANEITPMFCGSAFKNKGVQALLDAIVEYMPSPLMCRQSRGFLMMRTKHRRSAIHRMMSRLRHWRLR